MSVTVVVADPASQADASLGFGSEPFGVEELVREDAVEALSLAVGLGPIGPGSAVHLTDKDALTGPPIVKQLVEGERFAYLGRNYRLTLTNDADDTGVRLERGPFRLPSARVDEAATLMRRWYTDVGGQMASRPRPSLGFPPWRRSPWSWKSATSATAGAPPAQRSASSASTSTGRPSTLSKPHRLHPGARANPPP